MTHLRIPLFILLSTDNLISLNNFVLIQFGADTEVVPKESEWFG